MTISLRQRPATLKQANALIAAMHRHHKPVQGHRFSILVEDGAGTIHGACVVGRPVARMTDPYNVAEVTRLVTDGHKNACSFLYAAAARAADAMGFDHIQTFILESELGTSLRAAGWELDPGYSGGGDWNSPSRGGRRTDQPQEPKQKWVKRFRTAPLQRHSAQVPGATPSMVDPCQLGTGEAETAPDLPVCPV